MKKGAVASGVMRNVFLNSPIRYSPVHNMNKSIIFL